jgi:multidrug transporter EmrE-like cation transporter
MANSLPLFLSVFFSAAAQLLLKQAAVSAESDQIAGPSFFVRALSLPSLWLGLISFGLSLALWLIVLSRMPVSKAYPFVSLGIVLTVVGGVVLFNEPITPVHLFSIGLIVGGVSLLVAS